MARWSKESREEVRQVLRVDEVFRAYNVELEMQQRGLRAGHCPVCRERNRGDAVSVETRKNVWHCKRSACNAGGDALDAVAAFLDFPADEKGKIKWTGREAADRVFERAAEIAGVVVLDVDPRSVDERRRQIEERRQQIEQERARRDTEAAAALARALADVRQLERVLARRDDRGEAYLRARGLDTEQLIARGLVRFFDRSGGDPAVALYDEAGELVNLVRRLIAPPDPDDPKANKVKGRPGCPTPGTLAGRVTDIAPGALVVVVEGVVDSITAAQLWPGAVALGAHGGDQYAGVVGMAVRRLADVGGRLLLVLDRDASGMKAGRAAVEVIREHGFDPALAELAHLGPHEDLNDAHVAGWRPGDLPEGDDPRLEIEQLLHDAAEQAAIDAIAEREDEPDPPRAPPPAKPRKLRGRAVYLGPPGDDGGRVRLKSTAPLRLAEAFRDRHPHLVRWAGDFWRMAPDEHAAYRAVPTDALTAAVYRFLDRVVTERTNEDGDVETVPLVARRSTAGELVAALPAVIPLIADGPPCALEPDFPWDPVEVVVCPNGLLHLPSRELRPASPAFFATSGVDVAYHPRPAAPAAWTRFLHDIFEDDHDAIASLQEWMGYVLTPDTSLQKMLALIGPRRSGKGTIARIIDALLGADNVAHPTLSDLERPFGLAPFVGKQLAVIGDARLGGRTDQAAIAERLLSITGEDAQTIDRKHREPITVRLRTRLMLISNEPPRLADASAALASRFVVLCTRRSYLGQEDRDLEQRLVAELPGIFGWAIEGWDRLRARGRMLQPKSGQDMADDIEALGSPIKTFADDCLEFGAGYEESCQAVYDRWRRWCEDHGERFPGSSNIFARNLRAAWPHLPAAVQRGPERRRFFIGLRLVVQPGTATFPGWRTP